MPSGAIHVTAEASGDFMVGWGIWLGVISCLSLHKKLPYI